MLLAQPPLEGLGSRDQAFGEAAQAAVLLTALKSIQLRISKLVSNWEDLECTIKLAAPAADLSAAGKSLVARLR